MRGKKVKELRKVAKMVWQYANPDVSGFNERTANKYSENSRNRKYFSYVDSATGEMKQQLIALGTISMTRKSFRAIYKELKRLHKNPNLEKNILSKSFEHRHESEDSSEKVVL